MQERQLIRVLGPIDVMTPAGVITVGGRRVRALLGALVISAGHAVPIDHLRQVLWGDHPPKSADNTLQSYVSHLRRVLGVEVVLRVDHSYELEVGAHDIDARLFEELLTSATDARAEPERCRALALEALRLWRGRPFGDLADDDPFRLEAYRLDELRVTAMELSIEAELALGHHELVVGELENGVEEHPYRERLWYLLIEALERGDRRVEALRTCQRLRDVLADVGVDVGSEVAELEQRSLAHGEHR